MFFKQRKTIRTILPVAILWASTALYGQRDSNRTPGGASVIPRDNIAFTVRGQVYSAYANNIPEFLEVRLEKIGALVAQYFLRADHSFEFRNLPAGTYNIVIKDERFEEVQLRVEVYGSSPQTFLATVMLSPRKKDAPQAQLVDADDEIADTVSVMLLSKKIPSKAAKHYRKSLELENRKKMPEALAELKEALRLAPDFYSAQRNLGLLLFHSGHISDSIAPLEAALKLNPQSATVNYFLGLAYLDKKDFTIAETYFKNASSLHPEKAGPHYFLGYIHFKQNKMEEAEKSLRRAMERDPLFASYSRLQLANIYLKKSQLEEAYRQMEVFLKEQPQALEVSQVISNLKVLREILGNASPPFP